MDYFRAEATRTHRRRSSKWRGKWKKEQKQAIAQANRWQLREPFAEISIVSTMG
jgi:hypothetical protein